MLKELNYKNIEIVGEGSTYNVKNGKQTRGLAFFYIVNGGKKTRKVFTSSSDEDNLKKATVFLDKLDKEYEENKKAMSRISITDNSKQTEFVYEEKTVVTNLTFKEVGDMWFEEYSGRLNKKRRGISYSTWECMDLAYRTLCSKIGDMYLKDINQDFTDDFIEESSFKQDGTYYSFSYVDKLQQALHSILRYADERGLYKYELETVELDYLEKADSDSRFLDREQLAEVKVLLKDNDRYRILVDLIMSSGLRQEEAFALTLDDFVIVNKEDVEVHINKSVRELEKNVYVIVPYGKTHRSRRVVTIPYSVYNDVVKYFDSIVKKETPYEKELRQLNKAVGLIFADKEKKVPNKRTFERSFANYIKRRLKKYNMTLDYEVTLHMLRHSYASLMAETLPVEVVARLLGDTIKTTEDNYYTMSKKVKKNVSVSSKDIMKSVVDIYNDKIDNE